MRTGAIFARGSCRALKWMALLGMVLALGSGSVAAQDADAPKIASAVFAPGGMTVKVTMSERVYGSPDNGDFTLAGVAGLTVTGIDMATARGAVSDMITLTVSKAVPAGTTGLTLDYTQPSAEGKRIKDLADNELASIADGSEVAVAEEDVKPVLPEPPDRTFNEGDEVAFVLPAATDAGNSAATSVRTYSLTASDGSKIPNVGATPTAGTLAADLGLFFNPGTRTVQGTVGDKGDYLLEYTVAEADTLTGAGVIADADDVDSEFFTITVSAKGTIPTTGLEVEVKSVTAAATVAEGGSLEVKVTATLPAGKGLTIPMKTVTLTFPATHATIKEGEGAEEADFEVLSDTTLKDIKLGEEKSEKTYTFRVEIRRDLDAEDEKFQVQAQIDGDAVKTKDVLMIDDAQTQKYTLSLPTAAKGAITEGAEDATEVTLKADPARTMNYPVSVALSPNDPTKYMLGALSATEFGMSPTAVTFTIKALADKNRSEDTITVTAYTDGPLGNVALASLDIKVNDANALPGIRATLVDDDGDALAMQPTSVTEGETLMLMLTALDKDGDSVKVAEKLMVSLVPAGTAGAQDYRLSGHPIEIASGSESSAAVDLMVLADDDVGEEMLVFDAVVSGDEKVGPGTKSVMGVLSLTIMDGTMKLVWAKSMEDVQKSVYDAKEKGEGADKIFSPGEMIEVDASTLFNYAEGVTLNYVASSDAAAVKVGTSGSMVTVTAAEAGMANVTITAHANAPSGVVKILPQTEPDEASIMFPLEVGLEALSIMLSADEMNLVEGGMGATVTATANRAVTADTMVMLMRDRAMSSASDDDYMAGDITIKAGEMTGTTMVTATADDMMENEGNMAEELVLYGMAKDMAGEVTGELKFYIWDAAVPALPVIAQLLLAAFLAFGGYRRYLRR